MVVSSNKAKKVMEQERGYGCVRYSHFGREKENSLHHSSWNFKKNRPVKKGDG
jgi:ribosomal protein L20